MSTARPPLCPCVYCTVDRSKGRALSRARLRSSGRWWAPYGPRAGSVEGAEREQDAHLFGPRHAEALARTIFEVVSVNGWMRPTKKTVRPPAVKRADRTA